MSEIDSSCLVDCPEDGCDGIMMRISLPSELPVKWQCVVCGLATWDGEVTVTHSGVPMHTITVPIFTDWNE